MPGATSDLRSAAQARFGGAGRSGAVVLTHGHFDHVGPLETLAQEWDIPVYAHTLERRYLNGIESYPPPDPTVGGGLMSLLSPLYPRKPVDVGGRLQPLPEDGSVPGMPGWRWLHTPGHTPGHVSLWRETDRLLVAGDAFITTRQESAYAAITQAPEMHGPQCTLLRTGSVLARPCKIWPHSRLMSWSRGMAKRCRAWRCARHCKNLPDGLTKSLCINRDAMR
jgi:hypothetical protein